MRKGRHKDSLYTSNKIYKGRLNSNMCKGKLKSRMSKCTLKRNVHKIRLISYLSKDKSNMINRKRRNLLYKMFAQNTTKQKAGKQRYCCCYSSYSGSFNTDQKLTTPCKFKMASHADLGGNFC